MCVCVLLLLLLFTIVVVVVFCFVYAQEGTEPRVPCMLGKCYATMLMVPQKTV